MLKEKSYASRRPKQRLYLFEDNESSVGLTISQKGKLQPMCILATADAQVIFHPEETRKRKP